MDPTLTTILGSVAFLAFGYGLVRHALARRSIAKFLDTTVPKTMPLTAARSYLDDPKVHIKPVPATGELIFDCEESGADSFEWYTLKASPLSEGGVEKIRFVHDRGTTSVPLQAWAEALGLSDDEQSMLRDRRLLGLRVECHRGTGTHAVRGTLNLRGFARGGESQRLLDFLDFVQRLTMGYHDQLEALERVFLAHEVGSTRASLLLVMLGTDGLTPPSRAIVDEVVRSESTVEFALIAQTFPRLLDDSDKQTLRKLTVAAFEVALLSTEEAGKAGQHWFDAKSLSRLPAALAIALAKLWLERSDASRPTGVVEALEAMIRAAETGVRARFVRELAGLRFHRAGVRLLLASAADDGGDGELNEAQIKAAAKVVEMEREKAQELEPMLRRLSAHDWPGEESLTASVKHERLRQSAIRSLGRIGTIDSIATLNALIGSRAPGRRAVVEEAIAAIQTRHSTRIEAGAVTIVEGGMTDGALAVVEDE